jgi:hypothetical protein
MALLSSHSQKQHAPWSYLMHGEYVGLYKAQKFVLANIFKALRHVGSTRDVSKVRFLLSAVDWLARRVRVCLALFAWFISCRCHTRPIASLIRRLPCLIARR